MSCAGRKQSHDSSEEAGEEKSSKDHWILGISRISQKEGGIDTVGCLKLRQQRVAGQYQFTTLNWSLPATQAWNHKTALSTFRGPQSLSSASLTTSVSFYIPLQPSTHPLFWPRPLFFIQPPPHFGPCPVLPQQIHPDGCQLSSMSTPLQKQLSQRRQAWAADVNQGSTVIN